MKQTTVKYKKDRVCITMSTVGYAKMCKEFNRFNQAMNDCMETMDFRLSELNSMDCLRYSMIRHMGFEKTVKDSYYSDYQIPTIKEK